MQALLAGSTQMSQNSPRRHQRGTARRTITMIAMLENRMPLQWCHAGNKNSAAADR